jgi:hypothetical protein
MYHVTVIACADDDSVIEGIGEHDQVVMMAMTSIEGGVGEPTASHTPMAKA